MKIAFAGDLHCTDKAPHRRVDDYKRALFEKLNFVFELAISEECELICLPGDITDSPSLPYSFFIELSDIFSKHEILKFGVFGQHDMQFRRKDGTFLHAFSKVTENMLCLIGDGGLIMRDVSFTGVDFGGEIPPPRPLMFNILIIHKMIVDEKLWAQQEGHAFSTYFLRKYPYDLVISGDNHKNFVTNIRKRYLVNPGSIMRSSIDQVNHQPKVYTFDIDSKELTEHIIPVKDAEAVFDLSQIEAEKKVNENLGVFIDNIKNCDTGDVTFDFETKLRSASKAFEDVDKIIDSHLHDEQDKDFIDPY